MFITNKRYEEILQKLQETEVLEVIPKLPEEEARAFMDIYHGNVPKDEEKRKKAQFDRCVVDAYKAGVLTPEDDPYFLWE